MEDDWDLQAVVRSCCINRNSSADGSEDLPFEPRRRDHSLFQELKWNYLPKPENSSLNLLSQNSVLAGLQLVPSSPEQQMLLQPQNHLFSASNGSKSRGGRHNHHTTPRPKRRKTTVMKRVCHVAAESLSSDEWSWRKYGQKPIKGSPYPRGYYRCSTSKGCMARKQVERNRSDPGMFIVTYTSEHNHPMPAHRSSIAGATGQSKETAEPTTKSPDKTEVSTSGVAEDDDEDFSILNMAVEELFSGDLRRLTFYGMD